MPQQQEQSTKVSSGDALGIIYNLATCHAVALTPIIRSRHGSEAFGIRAVVALVIMALFTEGRWTSPMGVYLAIWLIFLVYRRIETLNNWRKGNRIHSRYIGDPWLAMRFRFIKDEKQARTFEPVMCLLLGAALAVFSPVLGGLVMAGFVSLGLCMAIDHFAVYKRLQHMSDAAMEGEYFGEEFRRMR